MQTFLTDALIFIRAVSEYVRDRHPDAIAWRKARTFAQTLEDETEAEMHRAYEGY